MHDSENGSQHFVHNEDKTTISTRNRTKMMDCEIKNQDIFQGNTKNLDILACSNQYTPFQFENELQFSNRSLNLHSLKNEIDNRFECHMECRPSQQPQIDERKREEKHIKCILEEKEHNSR